MKNLLFLLLLLVSCKSYENQNGSITVTGIAQDAKAGAILVTDDGAHYYIDGTDHWDKQLLGKRLTVTGELVEVTHEPQKGPEYRQGIVGTQKIIKKARIIRNM